MANDADTKRLVVLEELRCDMHAIRLNVNAALDEAEARIIRLELTARQNKSGLRSDSPKAA